MAAGEFEGMQGLQRRRHQLRDGIDGGLVAGVGNVKPSAVLGKK